MDVPAGTHINGNSRLAKTVHPISVIFILGVTLLKRGGNDVKPSIDTVWARLKRLQGEPFETKTGKPFTFEISGNIFHSSRTNHNLTKTDFAKVLELSPVVGPGDISNLVRGSAYIWAVLNDRRVRGQDW